MLGLLPPVTVCLNCHWYTHPRHFGSLAACFLVSADRTATSAILLESFKETGVRGEVTVVVQSHHSGWLLKTCRLSGVLMCYNIMCIFTMLSCNNNNNNNNNSRRAHLSVKVEVGYGLSREHFTSHPADVLVRSWDRGKPAAFDVTVASPLTPATLNEASVSAGAAAHVAENRTHAANDTKCQELGWSCIPLAVKTYGNWGKEAQYVFSRLASLLAVGQSSPKPKMVAEIYGRLNLSLVISVARAIMGREMAHG